MIFLAVQVGGCLVKGKGITLDRGVRISFGWGYSLKIRPTHRSIDDTLIQPKFVG